MGGLLANARKFFQGLTPSTVSETQLYRIACHCGQRLSGDRTTSYQALRCPGCGGGLFVLPRSPLPEPAGTPITGSNARTASPAKPARIDETPIALHDFVAKSDPEPVEDEIQWDEELPSETEDEIALAESSGEMADPVELAMSDTPTPDKETGGRVRESRKPVEPKKLPNERAPRIAKEKKAAPEPIVVRQSLGEFVLQHRNPLLLTMVAVVVFGTVGIRVVRSRWEQLPAVAELGRTQGLSALDAGDFPKANQLLSDARRAVELLGDAYQGAEAIRQGAKEAAIIVKLIPEGLEDLLEDANQSDKDDWRSRFQKLYQGQSVIIQAQIAAVPGGRGEGNYSLDYRILPSGEGGQPKTQAVVDLKGFRLLQILKPKVGDTLTFGARLASFQFDLEMNCWMVGLEPESGVTMTHEKALEALGWPTADDALLSETVH